MAKEECGNCRFWLPRSDHAADLGGGFCRRFPPQFQMKPGIYLNDGWPNTHQQSWCGEFKAKEQTNG